MALVLSCLSMEKSHFCEGKYIHPWRVPFGGFGMGMYMYPRFPYGVKGRSCEIAWWRGDPGRKKMDQFGEYSFVLSFFPSSLFRRLWGLRRHVWRHVRRLRRNLRLDCSANYLPKVISSFGGHGPRKNLRSAIGCLVERESAHWHWMLLKLKLQMQRLNVNLQNKI